MSSKARAIRKYQVSFGMSKREADVLYAQQQARGANPVKAKMYYSKILKRSVTVPDA